MTSSRPSSCHEDGCWQNEWKPELKAEGPSRCTIELEPVDDAVKSLLETGEIAITTHPGH